MSQLTHYIELWRKWTAEAERLESQYERAHRRHIERYRATHPQADDSSAELDWDNRRTAQALVSAGIWAHRKAQTFGIAVLVERSIQTGTS